MGFTSLEFIPFLILSLIAFYSPFIKRKDLILLFSSIIFYLSFSPFFLLILVLHTLINYFLGNLIDSRFTRARKNFLMIGILFNVVILAFFKYFHQVFTPISLHSGLSTTESYNALFSDFILPLGISFYTFTSIGYLIEVYRRTISAEKNLLVFSNYILFFPKLIQGPIERAHSFIPQLKVKTAFSTLNLIEGGKLILWGFFKKLVIADRLALLVSYIFSNPTEYSGFSLWIAAVFFTFQIYADFSGYTDIAIGTARLFGITLSPNFNYPYFSTSIKDFWTRWHISFSSWLRDYIFLPLAYSLSNNLPKEKYFFLKTEKIIYIIAIFVTYFICGIWHGVGYTYLIWGLLFAVFLSISLLYSKSRVHGNFKRYIKHSVFSKILNFFTPFFIFLLIVLTWIIFRSNTITDAWYIYKHLFDFSDTNSIIETIKTSYGFKNIFGIDKYEFFLSVFFILFLITADYLHSHNLIPFFLHKKIFKWSFYYIIFFMILIFGQFGISQFIYTKF